MGLWFQCKIGFYFTEWTPNAVFSRVAIASRENTSFGVHEWNNIQCYTKKNRIFWGGGGGGGQGVYAFIYNN